MGLNADNVFIAGATGLAGTTLVRYIAENYPDTRVRAGYHSRRPAEEVPGVEYVQGDISDPAEIEGMLDGCDAAVMLAACSGGAVVAQNRPWAQVTDNAVMNSRFLEACFKKKVSNVVITSTACVYPPVEKPVKEDDLDLNVDPAGAHFGVGWVYRYIEKICRFWHEKAGMNISVLRAANIYGPFDKFDPGNSNFIPALIRRACEGPEVFEVWGTADVVRDVIYVEDFAGGVCSVLGKMEDGIEIYNIGGQRPVTVGEVAEAVLEAADGKKEKLVFNTDKPVTIKYRALDCGKIKERTGWTPKYDLKQGIENTTKWWQQNKDWWQR